jgi:integrase
MPDGVRFHDLRHTFASMMLSYGESPWWISQQLGHADYVITLKVYAHLIEPERADVHPLSGKVARPPRPAGKLIELPRRDTA